MPGRPVSEQSSAITEWVITHKNREFTIRELSDGLLETHDIAANNHTLSTWLGKRVRLGDHGLKGLKRAGVGKYIYREPKPSRTKHERSAAHSPVEPDAPVSTNGLVPTNEYRQVAVLLQRSDGTFLIAFETGSLPV